MKSPSNETEITMSKEVFSDLLHSVFGDSVIAEIDAYTFCIYDKDNEGREMTREKLLHGLTEYYEGKEVIGVNLTHSFCDVYFDENVFVQIRFAEENTEVKATLRENKIATMAMRAGTMEMMGLIKVGGTVDDEESFADFCAETVYTYDNKYFVDFMSFDQFAENALMKRYGVTKEDTK